MAPSDGIIPEAAPAAPAVIEAPVAAPVVEATPVAPVVEAPAAPVVETAPVAEAAPATAEIKHHTDSKGLLTEGTFEEPTKPAAEAKPEGEQPAPVAQPEWQPVVYELTPADDIKIAPEGLERIQGKFNALRLSPEQAKDAFSAYQDEVRQYQTSELQRWNDSFKTYREEQRAKILADPVLGSKDGLRTIFRMRDALVPEADKAEFDTFMETTGASDHVAMARLFYRVNELVEARVAAALKPYQEAPAPAPTARATLSNGRDPSRTGMRAFYDKTSPGAR